jgi:RNA polymerase sigma-70 factor (ECF subfamily)
MKIIHSRKEEQEDPVLLEEYRNTGELKILGALYARYMSLVYGVCLKYLQNREDAGDAVMQIFEKLITEVNRHEIQNFRSWLYVLSKNFCLMKLRSEKSGERRMNVWAKEQPDSVEFFPDLHPLDAEDRDEHSALLECIEKLKDEQRDCIRLFYYQNWSYRQIAEILHMEEKKVKSHLQNAKRNLKICLEGNDVKE